MLTFLNSMVHNKGQQSKELESIRVNVGDSCVTSTIQGIQENQCQDVLTSVRKVL
ncbi:hypothetical protein MTR_1g083980 [Medicago truncatula]|uniref:Uncharacterized protein n=1 Tax=Medicago truncatula TaxID=3880 RepID=G7I9H3_MEDTR|nr:hypothetical protein MTR_1g083980 [Medicago truncatula]